MSWGYSMTRTSHGKKCSYSRHSGPVGCLPAPNIFHLANEFAKGKMFWNLITHYMKAFFGGWGRSKEGATNFKMGIIIFGIFLNMIFDHWCDDWLVFNRRIFSTNSCFVFVNLYHGLLHKHGIEIVSKIMIYLVKKQNKIYIHLFDNFN